MAKETKEKSKVYPLTDYIRGHKYYANIDGREFYIDFERDFNGNRITAKSDVAKITDDGIKQTGEKGFSNLTPRQVRELALARVIVVTGEDREIIAGV